MDGAQAAGDVWTCVRSGTAGSCRAPGANCPNHRFRLKGPQTLELPLRRMRLKTPV